MHIECLKYQLCEYGGNFGGESIYKGTLNSIVSTKMQSDIKISVHLAPLMLSYPSWRQFALSLGFTFPRH